MPGEGVRRRSARRDWTLTPAAFDRLLAALGPDRETAAARYEQLHARLTGLLRWWGGTDPESLADEVLDRVARKLEDGVAIPQGSLGAYVRGVARMIFYESTRRPQPRAVEREAASESAADADEARLSCLDHCLRQLERAERELALRYYDEGRKAEVRRRLAADLGISQTALRIRAHRLRARLERCVGVCLNAEPAR